MAEQCHASNGTKLVFFPGCHCMALKVHAPVHETNKRLPYNISTDETPARTTKLPLEKTFSHEGFDWHSLLPKN